VKYPWLDTTYNQLGQLIGNELLPHALLFYGAKGLGKEYLTKKLAELILCDQPQLQACGQCRSCILIKADTHPDLYVFEQTDSSISVEHIRSIITWVQSHPARSGSKVILLPNIENMTSSAANALLKILEEPPGKTCFLLTSSQLPALLPTVISRCQLRRIDANTNNFGPQYLQQLAYSEQQVSSALALAGGGPLLAQDILEKDNLQQSYDLLALFKLWLSSQSETNILVAKVEKQHLLLELVLADLIKVKMDVSTAHLSFPHQVSVLQEISQNLSLEGLQSCYQSLLAFNQALKQSSGLNVALQLTAILLRLKNV